MEVCQKPKDSYFYFWLRHCNSKFKKSIFSNFWEDKNYENFFKILSISLCIIIDSYNMQWYMMVWLIGIGLIFVKEVHMTMTSLYADKLWHLHYCTILYARIYWRTKYVCSTNVLIHSFKGNVMSSNTNFRNIYYA